MHSSQAFIWGTVWKSSRTACFQNWICCQLRRVTLWCVSWGVLSVNRCYRPWLWVLWKNQAAGPDGWTVWKWERASVVCFLRWVHRRCVWTLELGRWCYWDLMAALRIRVPSVSVPIWDGFSSVSKLFVSSIVRIDWLMAQWILNISVETLTDHVFWQDPIAAILQLKSNQSDLRLSFSIWYQSIRKEDRPLPDQHPKRHPPSTAKQWWMF